MTQIMTMFPKLPGETVEHRENLPLELEISGFKFESVISQIKARGVSDTTCLCVCVCVCVCIHIVCVYIYIYNIFTNLYRKGRKVNFTLEQAKKAQRGSRCVALLFLQPRR